MPDSRSIAATGLRWCLGSGRTSEVAYGPVSGAGRAFARVVADSHGKVHRIASQRSKEDMGSYLPLLCDMTTQTITPIAAPSAGPNAAPNARVPNAAPKDTPRAVPTPAPKAIATPRLIPLSFSSSIQVPGQVIVNLSIDRLEKRRRSGSELPPLLPNFQDNADQYLARASPMQGP